jgi:hypothetical protein
LTALSAAGSRQPNSFVTSCSRAAPTERKYKCASSWRAWRSLICWARSGISG